MGCCCVPQFGRCWFTHRAGSLGAGITNLVTGILWITIGGLLISHAKGLYGAIEDVVFGYSSGILIGIGGTLVLLGVLVASTALLLLCGIIGKSRGTLAVWTCLTITGMTIWILLCIVVTCIIAFVGSPGATRAGLTVLLGLQFMFMTTLPMYLSVLVISGHRMELEKPDHVELVPAGEHNSNDTRQPQFVVVSALATHGR